MIAEPVRSGAGGATHSRRELLGAGAALAGASMLPARAGAATSRKPNVVFVMADDLGAFDLSCYGRPDYRTPRIDSLAADGLKFDFGYSSSATCTPTRVGLISGRYPNRVPVGTVAGGGSTSETVGYYPEWPSIARMMRDAGYRTGLVGKWNLGPLPKFSPLKNGYDEFFGFSGGAIDYWTHDIGFPFAPGRRSADFYENDTEVDVEGYSTDLFTTRACDFIARHCERPFFLSLHYSAPHWPWQTRGDRASGRLFDVHYDGGSMRAFAEMTAAMDEGVGRVLDALENHELAADTIVIFTSDNGGERFSYMWPLRGQKGTLLEGGVRVPLLVRWPGHIAPGTTTGQVALSMDWLPTLAAIAGGRTDPAMPPDGSDLSAALLGGPAVGRTAFWKTPAALSALAFPWKYLREGEREHLFNLAEEVSENANYKLRHPGIFAGLKEAATEWEAAMLPSTAGDGGRPVEMLRSLDTAAPPDFPQ